MTPSQFKAAFPEFSSETDLRVQTFIDNADPFFDVARWDTLYFEGVSNFVAHKLTMANLRAGNTGGRAADMNTSKKVGDLAVGRSEAVLLNKQKNPFLATEYGQEYFRLAQLVGRGAQAV